MLVNVETKRDTIATMMDSAYAHVLSQMRSELNERFALHARVEPRLSSTAVHKWMRGPLQALFVALLKHHGLDSKQVLRECFEIALTLGCDPLDGVMQARAHLLEAACSSTLPKLAPLLASEPTVLRAFCNALMQRELDAQGWLSTMYQLLNGGAVSSVHDFKALGLLASWRCGMAHYRAAALKYLPLASDASIQIIFAKETNQFDVPALRAALLASPWLPSDSKQPQIRARIGGASVLNGPFAALPLVRGDQDQLYVLSQRGLASNKLSPAEFDCYQLHIDQFGHVLLAQGDQVSKAVYARELPNSPLPAREFAIPPSSTTGGLHSQVDATDALDLSRWGEVRAVVRQGPTWLVCHRLSYAITVLA
jgi:hypothetical protein